MSNEGENLIKGTLSMRDHDLLIQIDGKVNRLITDVKEMKDGVSAKINQVETRVTALEKITDEFDLARRGKQIDEMYQWMHDYRLTFKVLIGIAAAIGGVVGFILSSLNDIISLVEKTR